MCYYSSIKSDIKDMVREFKVIFPDSEHFKPAYSVSAFTFPKMPVISSDNLGAIQLFDWGLIPFWTKTTEQARSIRQNTLNARSETIFEKPAFRQAIRSKRCLVIADGFFEWRHVGNKRYPYYITLKSRSIFSFAGLWDSWANPDTNEKSNTFSIVTTEANSLMAQIHNTKKRMPLILSKENEKAWLNLNSYEVQIQEIMIPYDTKEMIAYPVANTISRLGYNATNRTVLEPFIYPGLPELT